MTSRRDKATATPSKGSVGDGPAWRRPVTDEVHTSVIADVVASFTSSLADPAHPTTCGKHINGCLISLKNYVGGAAIFTELRTNHHQFYATCMSFLSCPPNSDRVAEERQRKLQTCNCNLADDELSQVLHTQGNGQFPDLMTVFSNICMFVHAALGVAKAEGNVHKVEMNQRKALEKGLKAPLWPVEPLDLFPLGPDRTSQALEKWIRRYPLPPLLGLLGSYLEITKQAFLPHFISSSFFPGFFVDAIKNDIYEKWKQLKDVDGSYCAESLAYLKDAALVPRQLMNLCTEGQIAQLARKAEAQAGSIVELCGFVHEWLPKLILSMISPEAISTYRAVNIMNSETTQSDMRYIATIFLEFGALTHARLEQEKDPKGTAFQTFMSFYHDQRCYAPGCEETYAEAGRKFASCSGCSRVPYCSKSCLAAAWKHPRIPHKAVCKLIRELADKSGIPAHPVMENRDAFVKAIKGDEYNELVVAVSRHFQVLRKELSKAETLVKLRGMSSRRRTTRTSVNLDAGANTPDTSSVVSSFVSSLSDPTNPTTCSKHLVGSYEDWEFSSFSS
ncbi:uncharacterized protein STEHIDRAFT_156813 [Stereum hirsutum FP-91666 SS1]|uniref:uncharacterized protein n=1 Tax=Stereum hirsutum (strain FP-91666) TaxID=721885 RepID=UPI000440D279|nr:uncharacterized protein STEHIDRAFT_156813 [Stereum hirsutum FP-91666 SS1]EIM86507.1 hypothetical protein STEHIDRAFT_156813 [Stereum hirsutum FP-91666 SS1]